MEQRLENVECRVDRIEQILPTLATREDLKSGHRAAGDEGGAAGGHRGIGAAHAHDFDVVAESLRDDIRLVAEAPAHAILERER